jgi:hypothetical protein
MATADKLIAIPAPDIPAGLRFSACFRPLVVEVNLT